MSAVSEPGPSIPPEASGRSGREKPAPTVLPIRLVERLYAKAHGAKWQLSTDAFAEALQRSVKHHLSLSGKTAGTIEPPGRAEVEGSGDNLSKCESYLSSLHLEDLALACACAEGSESAWEHFVREFRPVLYAAARAVVGSAGSPQAGESAARELADSLYAELFGVSETGEERKSLFRYFHGRSKLSTWLRAVLTQRHVDVLRAARRTESLEEEDARGRAEARPSEVTPDPERARYLALLQATLTKALAGLEPRDRLRLSYYYVQDLTLAQIGRLLGEHEATVSRKLDRTRRELRKDVESALAGDPHCLSQAQLQLCFQYAREEWPFDLTQALSTGTNLSSEERGK